MNAEQHFKHACRETFGKCKFQRRTNGFKVIVETAANNASELFDAVSKMLRRYSLHGSIHTCFDPTDFTCKYLDHKQVD